MPTLLHLDIHRAKKLSAATLSLLVMMLGLATVAASNPTFTSIDYPGASQTDAVGINSLNQIVGVYYTSPDTPPCVTDFHNHVYCGHGFLLTNGVFVTFNGPNNNPVVQANAINDNGQVIGSTPPYFFGVGNGFLYNSTASQYFLLPAAPGACAGGSLNGIPQTATGGQGINNLGQIVGTYEDCSGAIHGFLLTGFPGPSPVFTTIDVPGAQYFGFGNAWGINNRGQIVGDYLSGGIWHGFLRGPGETYTSYDFPASQSPTGPVSLTIGQSINDVGQIVGYYTGGNVNHGFLLSNGVFTNIDFPSAVLTDAQGINNAGDIVGAYQDTAGHTHGFILVRFRLRAHL